MVRFIDFSLRVIAGVIGLCFGLFTLLILLGWQSAVAFHRELMQQIGYTALTPSAFVLIGCTTFFLSSFFLISHAFRRPR